MVYLVGAVCLAAGFVGGMWWEKNRAKVAAAALADANKVASKL